MNSHIFNYSIKPSVVKADVVSTITIHPLGENADFKQGEVYTVSIRGVETACSYYNDLPTAVYSITPNEAGDLVVEHLFQGEQRHVIMLDRPESDSTSPYYEINNHRRRFGINIQAVLNVYSLNEDLYGMRCYKGEVHCHTFESDGIQDAIHTVSNYRGAGYDFLAITDHFTSYASEKSMRVFDGAPLDMTLMLGEEVHAPTERIHAVHLGGRESVNEYFRQHEDEARAEVQKIQSQLELPDNINAEDYAWRIWIAQKSREFGGLSILAHPHWIWFNVYFMSEEITKRLLREEVYDALDLRDTDFNTSVALWNDLRAQGVRIPVVASTDSHETNCTDPKKPAYGGYTLVFAPDRSPESIMDAIRSERSLAVNAAFTPEVISGPYRLVKFARFLMENYYPAYIRLCYGQGVVMSDYPVTGSPSEETRELLAGLNKRSETFAHEFFGY